MRCFCTSVFFVAALHVFSMDADAGIINGEFAIPAPGGAAEPFIAWQTSFGTSPEDGGGFARFVVGGFGDEQQLEQVFEFPGNATALSFEFRLTTAGDRIAGTSPDSFQVSLFAEVNGSFQEALFPAGPLSPPFLNAFNVGDDQQSPLDFDPTFVSVQQLTGGVQRVLLDVSSLSSQDLLLDFFAAGSNDGFQTTVELDNVRLATPGPSGAVPEPASLLVWSLGIAVGGILVGDRRRRGKLMPDA